MATTQLFSIEPSKVAGQLDVSPVSGGSVTRLPGGFTSLLTLDVAGEPYVLAFAQGTHRATFYRACESGKFLVEAASQDLTQPWSVVEPFQLGGQPWLMTYPSDEENLAFWQVNDDLSLTAAPFDARIGSGVSTLRAFAYRYGTYFVAYDVENGDVARWELSVPSNQPIYAQQTWTDVWARGWTRFGFFQMGGETFFIKTNVDYGKVNVDHFMDDADEGSHPVLNIDVPAQMKGLEAVATFSDPTGDPYFVTYRATGEMTFNRFHGNLLGWDVEAESTASEKASSLITFAVGKTSYALVYGAS